MKKYIEIKANLCSGCRICEMVCSLHKFNEFNPFGSGIIIISEDNKGVDIPALCRQCRNPACVKVCPAERVFKQIPDFEPPIYRDTQTGIIWLDSKKEYCLGCNECMRACPFGAIRLNLEEQQLVKCDLCGGHPECVEFCPTGAIKLVDFRSPRAEI